MKLKLNTNRLDNRVKGNVELHGEVFAYLADGDRCYPNYTVFVDTTECKETHPYEKVYSVPDKLLSIPHERGGGHGDLRLRYNRANVIFMPMRDYDSYFKTEPGFLEACEILYGPKVFIKGTTNLLSKLGVKIVGE